MRGQEKRCKVARLAATVALAALLGACDADSPTEPTQTPNAPVPTTATSTFAISVGLSPGVVTAGEPTTVLVSVVARRTDTGELMPRGSTALLSTTSGILTNTAGAAGSSIGVTFDLNGTATATLSGALVTATIRARIEQSFGEATLTVQEAPAVVPFTLIAASPNFGPPTGGTEVFIEGTGFSGPAEVVFGGIPVSVLSISSNVIRVLSPPISLPAGTNQTVGITVNINVGELEQATGTLASAFTYTRNTSPVIPQIISVTPTFGPNEGGTRVTIFGEGFGSEIQVFFGASSFIEAPVLDVTSTRILVETPPATGPNSDVQNSVVPVRVVDLRSGFEAVKANAFQYGGGDMQLTSIQPTEGLYLGGTLVTIFATGGFEAPVAVSFGGFAQQIVSVSGTEVVVRTVAVEVSCDPPSSPVTAVNIETGESFSGVSYLYRTVTPEIGGLAPGSTTADVNTGMVIGATTTTITGAGFDRQSRPPIVSFGGIVAPGVAITSLDPRFDASYGIGDVMVATIPPAPLPWPTEDCTVGNETGTRFAQQQVEVVVTARDTGCTSGGLVMTLFTYLPSDNTCNIAPVAPVAQFSFVSTGATSFDFTDLSSNSPTTLQWDFGDGAVENGFPGETRGHDFVGAIPGDTFSVKLSATNSAGTGQITKTVTIP